MHPAERNALADLDARIATIERRLQNAMASRDSFVEFLKSKYPLWSSSLTGKMTTASKDTILNRLSTSDYNWDEEWDSRTRVQQRVKQPQLYQDIPIGGPFLMSDVARVRRRLKEIARNLNAVRETRLNLTTEDYFRTRVDFEAQNYENEDTLLAIRSRLNDISLMTFEPLATPTSEQMSTMKFEEQREAYIADLRAGRVLPATTAAINPPSQPPLSNSNTAATTFPATLIEMKERTGAITQAKDDFQPQQVTEPEVESQERRLITFQEKMQNSKPTEIAKKGDFKRESVFNQYQDLEDDVQARFSPSLMGSSLPREQRRQLGIPTVGVKKAHRVHEIIIQKPQTQPTSTYKTMLELFGGHSTSDTDDDVNATQKQLAVPTKPPSTLDKPVEPQSTSQTSSAGILSQYLAAASSKTKDSTTSDSDDDFFK